jgi:hypothetical protein
MLVLVLVLVPLLQELGQPLLWEAVQLRSLAESSVMRRVSKVLLLKSVAGSWLFPFSFSNYFLFRLRIL